MDLGAVRVLVVDDDMSVRRLLRVVLPLVGHYVIVGEAASSQQALDLVAEADPDIIVLDHMMPIQTGAAAAGHLKRACPDADIVFFSAYTDALDAGHEIFTVSVELGCEIAPKGDTTRLEEALSRVVERRARFVA